MKRSRVYNGGDRKLSYLLRQRRGGRRQLRAHTMGECRIKGNTIQFLKPSKGGTGPNRWQILLRIPKRAVMKKLHPVPGGATKGREYTWHEPASGKKMTVRIHNADPSAPRGSNAAKGWIIRILRGKHSMDTDGTFHPPGIFNPSSPFHDPALVNRIHIPIIRPKKWPKI